jgi:outer membrane receptor protein involved in Fe transport
MATYFDESGNLINSTAAMETRINSDIRNPHGLHWNLSWEHEWLPRWVGRVNYIQKRGRNQVRVAAVPQPNGFDVVFNNSGQADYRAIEFAVDRPIRTNLRLTASYMYSKSTARPSLSLEFPDPALEDVLEAPTEWDSPHRFVSWGYFPFLGGLNASYSVEARSGLSYSLYDELNRIQGDYNEQKFPAYIVTNVSVEREIPIFFGKRIAFRVGVTNLFNRFNPRYADSNIDSPQFGRFADSSDRHFVGRVRLLKK